jgi:hypothetical protein
LNGAESLIATLVEELSMTGLGRGVAEGELDRRKTGATGEQGIRLTPQWQLLSELKSCALAPIVNEFQLDDIPAQSASC